MPLYNQAVAAGNLPAATTTTQGAVILDGTAGDIQASPGTQAAGNSTKAAAATHVHPQPAMFAPAGLTGATGASRYAGATTAGAPTTGTFAAGDYVVDQAGTFWVCTTAGTPGTWICPPGDPWGAGANLNYASPAPQVTSLAMNTANRAVYTRFCVYGYAMSSVLVDVISQSGNVCAAVYAPNSSNPAVPGAQVLSSGSVACGTGGAFQTLSLGGSVTIGRGYWVGFIADNTSATFRQLAGNAVPGDVSWAQIDSSAGTFPLASGTPTTTGPGGSRYPILASVS